MILAVPVYFKRRFLRAFGAYLSTQRDTKGIESVFQLYEFIESSLAQTIIAGLKRSHLQGHCHAAIIHRAFRRESPPPDTLQVVS